MPKDKEVIEAAKILHQACLIKRKGKNGCNECVMDKMKICNVHYLPKDWVMGDTNGQ
jgi:hypothetical protein